VVTERFEGGIEVLDEVTGLSSVLLVGFDALCITHVDGAAAFAGDEEGVETEGDEDAIGALGRS
jgi:hypothetical protein